MTEVSIVCYKDRIVVADLSIQCTGNSTSIPSRIVVADLSIQCTGSSTSIPSPSSNLIILSAENLLFCSNPNPFDCEKQTVSSAAPLAQPIQSTGCAGRRQRHSTVAPKGEKDGRLSRPIFQLCLSCSFFLKLFVGRFCWERNSRPRGNACSYSTKILLTIVR